MYLGTSLTSGHMSLFGGNAAAAKDRLTWGIDTLSVFNRPISSANAVLAPDPARLATKTVDAVVARAQQPAASGYHDWVNKMVAFRKAAAENLPAGGDGSATAAETQDSAAPATTEASPSADTGSTDQSVESGSASTAPGSTDETSSSGSTSETASTNSTPTNTASSASTSTGSGGGGLLGLFGRR